MQIFSTSHTHFSSPRERIFSKRGFTLVELLISIAIIGVVTSLVLVKYSAFDSSVLLKGVAYEIALSLREAQVKSVSVARGSGEFDYPYGITFTPEQKDYTVFLYKDPLAYPSYDDSAEDIRTFTIDRTMQVSDVCISTDGGTNYDCSISRLDVSFRRPEFKAIFFAEGFTGGQDSIQNAKIEVNATESGGNTFVVEVTGLGQISVYLKP